MEPHRKPHSVQRPSNTDNNLHPLLSMSNTANMYPGVAGALGGSARAPAAAPSASSAAPPYSAMPPPRPSGAETAAPASYYENALPDGEKLPTYQETVRSAGGPSGSAYRVIAPPGSVVIVNTEALPTYVDEEGLVVIPVRAPVSGLYCPHCQAPTTTVVSNYPSSTAVMSSVLLCWIAPIFAFMPLCMVSRNSAPFEVFSLISFLPPHRHTAILLRGCTQMQSLRDGPRRCGLGVIWREEGEGMGDILSSNMLQTGCQEQCLHD